MKQFLIKIGFLADTAGIDRATQSLRQADAAADQFLASINAGIGIDIGGKIVNAVAAIPGAFQAAIDRGMQFNITMNNAEVGIQNVLAKFLELDQAGAESAATRVMQQLIELEPKAAGGLEDLVNGFMATAAASLGVGLSVEQNIDLVGKFANALANAGRPIQQIGQEMRSLLQGQAGADSDIAKILFGSATEANEAMKAAKEAGTVFDVLVEKMGRMGEAGDSAAVRMSSLDSAIGKTLGKVTKPIFDVWMDSMTEFARLAGGDAKALEALGYQIATLTQSGLGFTKWLLENNALLINAAKLVGGFVAAWTAFKVAGLVSGLASKTRALIADTLALKANTAEQLKNNAAGAGAGRAGALGRVAKAGAGLGVGVALAGFDAMMQWAGAINEATAKSEDLGKAISQAGSNYGEMIRSAQSLADKQEIIKGLEEAIADLRKRAVDANEEDQDLISTGIKLLGKQLEMARNLSEEKLRQAEATKAAADAEQKAAEERAKERAENAKSDARALADFARRQAENTRDSEARQGLDLVEKMATKGNRTASESQLGFEQEYYSEKLAQAQAEQPNLTGDALKDNLNMQTELQGYLDAIREARAKLPELIKQHEEEAARKRKETEEKATAESVKALQAELALVEAMGARRLADAEGAGLTELELAKSRKKIEDEIAARRLQIEDQIGSLQKESDNEREARQIAADTAAKLRANDLAAANRAANETPRSTAGINARAKHMRGTSGATMAAPIDITETLRPMTDLASGTRRRGSAGFGTAPSVSPVVPPVAQPGSGVAGGPGGGPASPQGGGPGAAASSATAALTGITKMVGDIATAAESALKAIESSQAAKKLSAIGSAVRQADDRLAKEIEDVKKQIV